MKLKTARKMERELRKAYRHLDACVFDAKRGMEGAEFDRWKPAAAPYLAGCLALGLSPRDVVMVAAHSWDVHGAHRAGLRTAWITRLEQVRSDIFAPADIEGLDLPAVAAQIVGSST